MAIKMDSAALSQFLREEFPQAGENYIVEAVGEGTIRTRFRVSEQHLRPGGTVSGPTLFSLADITIYLAVLSQIGPQALAVTTNCSIDFMRKPAAATDLIAEGRLLKLGRVLAVGDVLIRSDGGADPVARATLTYSIPPNRAG